MFQRWHFAMRVEQRSASVIMNNIWWHINLQICVNDREQRTLSDQLSIVDSINRFIVHSVVPAQIRWKDATKYFGFEISYFHNVFVTWKRLDGREKEGEITSFNADNKTGKYCYLAAICVRCKRTFSHWLWLLLMRSLAHLSPTKCD